LLDRLARGKNLERIGYADPPALHSLPGMAPKNRASDLHRVDFTPGALFGLSSSVIEGKSRPPRDARMVVAP
jgi:hypothetical protein